MRADNRMGPADRRGDRRRPRRRHRFERIRQIAAVACGGLTGVGFGGTMVHAGEADVLAAVAEEAADGWIFTVTVAHADTGWEHYADAFEILAPDGAVIATRVLLHPHVDEQPFTRSQAGVDIPPEIPFVTVRAHDSVHGHGGAEVRVELAPVPPM